MTAELQEELFQNGDEWLAAASREIQSAKKFIYFESYIFNSDETGKRVLDLLKGAAARGVRTIILVDGIGSPGWTVARISELAIENIESRIYHPPPWLLAVPWFVGFHRLAILIQVFGRLNNRNHRKTLIVDGHTAIIGSNNVADCHMESVVGDNAWRDTSVRVKSREVEHLMRAFELTWERSWYPGKKWRPRLPGPVRSSSYFLLNDLLRLRFRYYSNLIERVRSARKQICITSAYFVPRTRLLSGLKRSARRGADVRILVPSKTDVPLVKWATIAFYEEMLEAGIRIFEYGPNILHAKSMIIDDWAIVGSSNFNHRSILHDLEVDVVLKTDHAKKKLLEIFNQDLMHSREILKKDLAQRSWFAKMLSRFAIAVRYWL